MQEVVESYVFDGVQDSGWLKDPDYLEYELLYKAYDSLIHKSSLPSTYPTIRPQK